MNHSTVAIFSVSIVKFLIVPSLVLHLTLLSPAQDTAPTPNSRAAKYHSALLKRPSSGYLFDRFFNAWLDTDTIDALSTFLKSKADSADAATGDRLLFGYFLVKQGREAEALSVFEAALEADPKNAEARGELAKARARTLDFDKAVVDLDAALALDPKPELAIELGKLKGRWLSRSGKSKEALAAWRALADAHPGDDELREDLVDLQLGESLIEEALATQKQLADSTEDPYLKITRQLRLGDIFLRSGQREEAKKIYLASLAAAGRDTWLEKEILAQIEQLFRREDDVSGLKNTYIELAKSEAGRIAVLQRLATVHAELDEADEAVTVYEDILKKTPGDRGNREAFVALLGQLGKANEAVEQMNALVSAHPNDVELTMQLARWQHRAEQPEQAKASVLKFLDRSDGSEYSYLRAARMLEQFKQTNAAEAIFTRLLTAFPDSIGAKEERAAFLYRAEKKEEAAAIWKSIAKTGSNQDAVRAARMLSSRGLREDAYQILKKRVDEFSTDFVFLGRLCEEAKASDHSEEAIPWVKKRLALATSPGDLSDALRQALTIFDRAKKTDEERERLTASKDTLSLADACLLAELLERNGEHDHAENVLAPWMEKGEVLALNQRVRQLEYRDDWKRAAEVMRRIVDLPNGRRSNHLESLVKLYRRALDYENALTWIEEWKKTSPGSVSPWLRQAVIQNEDGKTDAAIDTLRKTAARFEDEETPLTLLAGYYRQQGKLADAERIYWNLYEESEDIGEKMRWVGGLSSVAEQQGQAERLVEQFQERRRANRTSIAPLLAIAEIHRRTSNYEGRREALLEATRLRPEDLNLLQQIARIEEQEGNWERAVDTLESALGLDKTIGTKRRIALLHLRYGDEEVAYQKFTELGGGGDMDADAVLSLADAMIARNGWERAIKFLDEHRSRFPDDYRIGYLRSIALEESAEYDTATEAFLELLAHDKELSKTATTNTTTVSPSNWMSDYYGKLPKGTVEFMQTSGSNYYAFYYRQRLRSGSVNFQSISSRGGSGLVRLPNSLTELKTYSTAHLRGLSQSLGVDGDDAIKDLARSMKDLGVEQAEILLAMPFADNFSSVTPDYAELVEQFPNSRALLASAVVNYSNSLRNQNGLTADPEILAKCYEDFKVDHPILAFVASLCGARLGEEKFYSIIRTFLDDPPEFEKVPYILTNSISQFLIQNVGEEFPEDLKSGLLAQMQVWREQLLAYHEKKNKSRSISSRFPVSDEYAVVLRKSEDLTDFVSYLDEQSERYAQAAQGVGFGSASQGQSSLGSYLRYATRNQAMLSPLSFPPPELPGIAPNVLFQFIEMPGISFGYAIPPIDPDEAKRVAALAKDPILATMLHYLGEDLETAEKKIEGILTNAKRDRDRLPLREALFAASFYQTTEEWDKAAELLESVRLLPMSRTIRQRIDSALVVSARESGIDKAKARAEDAAKLAKWGPSAALRLRYGFLSSGRRNEVAGALRDFGFDAEADRLEAKTAASSSSSSTSFVRTSTGARGISQQINKLVKDKKTEQAEKLLSRTLMQNAKQIAATGVGQWDYELMRLLYDCRRNHSVLLKSVYQQAKPADDANIQEWMTYAALLEMDGRLKEAGELYIKTAEQLSDSAQKKYLSRIAIVVGAVDPQKGLEWLKKVDPRLFPQLSNHIEAVRYTVNYSGNRHTDQAKIALNQMRMLTAWLKGLDEKERNSRNSLAWLEQNGRYRLGDYPAYLYATGKYREIYYSSSDAKKRQKEEQVKVHQELCRAFIDAPQLSRIGFSAFAAIEVNRDSEAAFSSEEIERLAALAMMNHAKRPATLHVDFYDSWNYVVDQKIPLWAPEEYLIWKKKKEGALPEDALAVVELAGEGRDRETATSAKAFYDLVFGSAESFGDAFAKYIDTGSRSFNRGHRTYHEHANMPVHSTAAKAFLAWQDRKDELGDSFDLGQVLIPLLKRARQNGQNEATIVAAEYIVWLAEHQGWSVAENYLYSLTEVWLGKEKNWGRFKKTQQQRVPSGGGGFYYRGGNFPDSNQRQLSALYRRLGWEPSLVFGLNAFTDKHGLDHNKQISQNTLAAYLDRSSVKGDKELVRRLYSESPFLAEASGFRAGIYREGRDPAIKVLLDAVKRWAPKDRGKFVEFLASKDTFGGKVSHAYVKGNLSRVANVLAEYRAEIESMSAPAKSDLGYFVSRVFPKGAPDDADEDALAVFELLGAERAASIRDEAEEFLKLKDLKAVGIDYESELDDKMERFINPLLQSGHYEEMAKIYWHGTDLATKHKKQPGGWGSNDSAWNHYGDVLSDSLSGAPGGGLERIAFFVRLIREDSEGKIAVYRPGKFATILKESFESHGGTSKFDEALNAVFSELWDACGGEGPTSLIAYACDSFVTKLKPAEMAKAIAWANGTGKSSFSWAPLAAELDMAWRMMIDTTEPKGFESHRQKIAEFDQWKEHYTKLLRDDSLSLPVRVAISGPVVNVKFHKNDPEVIYAGADIMARILAADGPFNGWRYVNAVNLFNQLPKDERWIAHAEKLHEGWVHKNRNNRRDHNTGLPWDPWDDPALINLEMHAKLGDREKLAKVLKEENMANRMTHQLRGLFCLVRHGLFEEAREQLDNCVERGDIGLNYSTARNTYSPRYHSAIHEQIPKFLETIEESGLRYFAGICLLGAPDLAPDQKEKDPPYLARWGRLAEASKRFAEIEFGEDTNLRRAVLRNLAINDNACWLLRKEYAEATREIDQKGIPSLQDTNKIALETRIPSALAVAWCKSADIRPVRQFIEAINGVDDNISSYYRREAIEQLSARLGEFVKNRIAATTNPKEVRGFYDAVQLLAVLPKKDLIDHSALQTTVMMKIATDVIAAGWDDLPPSTLKPESQKISEARMKKLQNGAYRKRPLFWSQLAAAMKLASQNPLHLPDDKERRRRIEAVLRHPLAEQAVKKEEEIWVKMERNKWVKKGERESQWGKELAKLIEEVKGG